MTYDTLGRPSCRICRAEVYRVKYTCLCVIDSINQRSLEASSPESLPDVAAVVKVLDHILEDEYCSEHRTLDRMPSVDATLVCGFCGADIFQSFLQCSCGAVHLLCATCYVEGRIYLCEGGWRPKQMRRFDELIAVRNRAVRNLLDFGVAIGDDVKEILDERSVNSILNSL